MTATETSEERHRRRHAHAYATGVLVPEEHRRLVEDIDFYAEKAGVPPEELWTHAKEVCNDRERMWVKQVLRRGDVYGYGLIGAAMEGASKARRCRAMVAACVRNFVNARFVTGEDLYQRLQTGERDLWDVTLVACPDFIPATGVLPDWKKATLASWLVNRTSRQLYTVIGIPTRKAFALNFGPDVRDLLIESFEATVYREEG